MTHLLLCGEGRQLVENYVVFCSDGGQSRGEGQVQQVGQTARVVLLLLLLPRHRAEGREELLAVDAARCAGLPHS